MRVRKVLSSFEPYSWEPSNDQIASQVGLNPSKLIRMDTNTSPYLPTKSLKALSRELDNLRVNDYPDTSYIDLRKKLSLYCEQDPERFVVTNGADEALDIIAKTLIEPGDEVIIPIPSYSMFRVTSEICGGKAILVPRKKEDFDLDISAITERVNQKTRLIFVCSPNNPTGNSATEEQVRTLLEKCKNATIVVDEAYFEFSDKTLAKLIHDYDNLAIVRTFSKAFSMAGVRVGYILSDSANTKKFNIVRPPNSVGIISLFLAQSALKDQRSMKNNVKSLVLERKRMIRKMTEERNIYAFPSEANFVLFRVKGESSEKLYRYLMRKGFVLRNFSKASGVKGCLRVTVNVPEVNKRFLHELSIKVRSISS